MPAKIIDGVAVAQHVRAEVKVAVGEFVKRTGNVPGLATVLVGDDPASAVYVANKQKACQEVGIQPFDHRLPADASEAAVAELLIELNNDPAVSGILLQLPVPAHMSGTYLTGLIDPDKDVDGLTSVNAGRLLKGEPGLRPCTPLGILELLHHEAVTIAGANVVVVGRSELVGKPVAHLLLQADATVTICHARTRDLAGFCAGADILVAAVGQPEMFTAEYVKAGAVVIDVGINRTAAGLVGDVDFASVQNKAAAITPVPGGVGPMTIAMLLRNTLEAAG